MGVFPGVGLRRRSARRVVPVLELPGQEEEAVSSGKAAASW